LAPAPVAFVHRNGDKGGNIGDCADAKGTRLTRLAIAAGIAACAFASSALAADLIVDKAVDYATPSGNGLYIELLAGAALPGTYEYTDPDPSSYDIPLGGAVAGVIGFDTGLGGLSVEGDVFASQRDYGSWTLTTATAMAALKFTAELDDTFAVYGAAGLGGFYLHDEDQDGSDVWIDGWGLGYLLKAGVTAQVADNVSLVGELRYANSFAPIEYVDPFDGAAGHVGVAAALVGVKLDF